MAMMRRPRAEPHTILVAQDDPIVRALLARVLRGKGYTVLEAADAAEAARLVGRYAGPIDLLLADLAMPELAGRAVVRALRRARPRMGFLLLSGHPPEIARVVAGLPPAVAFLERPCTEATVSKTVCAALGATADAAVWDAGAAPEGA
jgi:two-component system, cell cycle sensor histidine kinase and response regulator CckA